MSDGRDRLAHAIEQAAAQFDSIKELVAALRDAREPNNDDDEIEPNADPSSLEDAERAIHEDALCVEVRSDWYAVGADDERTKPTEYCILLCTGGPAVRLTGKLNTWCEPETARLECQDWFTPWAEWCQGTKQAQKDAEAILLDYARCFYFGEG